MNTWIYLKVYASEPKNPEFHEKVLRECVEPLREAYSTEIRKLFLTRYGFDRRDNPENEGVPPKEEPIERRFFVGPLVAFLRIRFLVDSNHAEEVRNRALSLIRANLGANGFMLDYEDKPYDFDNDIGERFGPENRDSILDFLDSASRLYLQLIANREYDSYPRYTQRVTDAMHLSANILDFHAIGTMRVGRGESFDGQI